MKTFKFLFWFLFLGALVVGCQKELSREGGSGGTTSDGSLQSDLSGDCLGSLISGVYKKDTVLNTTHFIDVKVDVFIPGTYTITSDTVNGFYFNGSGTFTVAGLNTVHLTGTGKPTSIGTHSFTIKYDSTECVIDITTIDGGGGGGGGGAATFTLQGAPSACTGATTQGVYTASTPTTNANTATVQVNVTAVGTYSISTTAVNGVTFSATGTFTATGAQPVVLAASGTPTASGTFSIPLTVGTSTCNFPLTVGSGSSAAVFTLVGAPSACTGATVQGTYTLGAAVTASNTATIQVNVTTIGTYNITTNTVNGVSFAASGNFTTTGPQPVILTATGTPAASGNFTYNVTAGTSTCNFSVTVAGIDYFPRTVNSNWSYEFDDDPTDTVLIKVIPQTLSALGNTYNIFMQTYDQAFGFDTSGYYRKNSGDYYSYLDVANWFFFDAPVWGEFIFLKDNVAVGTNWTSPVFTGLFSGTPLQVRFRETIMQKDISVTVNGVPYANTIVVKEEYQYNDGTTWQSFFLDNAHSVLYYARNIGLIKWDVIDDTSPDPQGKQEVYRHQVF